MNVEWEKVYALSRLVNYWIIDIKNIYSEIYEAYIELSNEAVISNLKRLSKIAGKEKIRVRVPGIKGYNNDEDIQNSKEFVSKYAGELEKSGLDLDDLDMMDADERREALEDVGLNPDDYE